MNSLPEASVECAVGKCAPVCGDMLPECLGKGRAGELAVAERAARERGVVEYAVGEVTTIEGDIGEKRTGEVAIKELAVGDAATGNLKFDEFRFRSMEPTQFNGFERSTVGIAKNVQRQFVEGSDYARRSQLVRR